MNTSVGNLTHKMQRAAVGKMADVVLSHADKDRQKTVGQLVDVAKQFYGSSFSDEAYEHARQTLTDPRQQVVQAHQLRAGSDQSQRGPHHGTESGL